MRPGTVGCAHAAVRTNTEHRVTPEERAVEGAPRLRIFDWGGEGPAVLLLHGATHHARVWDGVAQALSGFRVIAADMRGHGAAEHVAEAEARTGRPAGGYGELDYSGDLERLVAAVGEPELAIVGHSLGSLIAQQYAATHSDRLWAVAFLDINARPPRSQHDRLRTSGSRPARVLDDRAAVRERVAATTDGASEEAVERLTEHGFVRLDDGRYRQRYDQRTLAEWPAWDNRDRLPAIACPALAMRAEHGIMDDSAAEAMSEALPRGRLVEIAGAGHPLHITHPEAVAEELQGFLDGALNSA